MTHDRHSTSPLFRLDVSDDFGIFPSSHSPYTLGIQRSTLSKLPYEEMKNSKENKR